ncbi:MAG: DUF4974 domain-containing protein [Prevotellaceae bacterium]|jgi:ferric-dicitrate binding protein FerR (iron transport regulator)|nr:DUF4974 domain-containing protein [Prevotellaceae bacterium]
MDERIVKYFNSSLSEEEKEGLIEEINQNNELRQQYLSYLNLNGLLALQSRPDDLSVGKQAYGIFKQRLKPRVAKRKILARVSQAAAVLVILLTTWFVSQHIAHERLINNTPYNEISVPPGQRVTVILSDGTEVWLNAGSTLKYPAIFGSKNRKVEIQGEGFFKVVSDPVRPFTADTPSLSVKVLGTSFNVIDYETADYAEVALEQGAVEIYIENDVHRLTPGEFLSLSNGVVSKGRYDENHFLWKTGIYHFNSVPLADIAKKLETYYDVTIDIQNASLKDKIYTGKFRQQDGVGEILRIIAKTCEFQIEREDLSTLYILK